MPDLRAKNGGARKGAGRSKMNKADKKNYVLVWLKNSLIKSNGGRKSTQTKIIKTLQQSGWEIN